MSGFLIVSDPPHASTDYDRAADLLGLTSAEARLKERFPAPEIWGVYSELSDATDRATQLEGVGLDVSIIDAEGIGAIPEPRLVGHFEFQDSGLQVVLDDGIATVPYDASVVVVLCRPPKAFADRRKRPSRADGIGRRSTGVLLDSTVGRDRRRSYSGVPDDLERAAFVDIYRRLDEGSERFTVASNFADFSGLGDAKTGSAERNVGICLDLCRDRFSNGVIDARLDNVRPRSRVAMGAKMPEGRKLLSFGTTALTHLLDSVGPNLPNITQYELGSRLAYLIADSAGVGLSDFSSAPR